MDPMEYVLHGNQPRTASHYDPVHAASGASWMPHPQSSQPYQWASHAGEAPLPFGLQRPHQMPDHFQHVHNGGLPPPAPGFRGMPAPENHSGLSMPMRNWPHPIHQLHGMTGGPPPGLETHINFGSNTAFGAPQPGAPRGLGFQSVPRPGSQNAGIGAGTGTGAGTSTGTGTGTGLGTGPVGATPEHNPQPRWSFSSTAPSTSANIFGISHNSSSHSPAPPHPFSPSSPHRHTSHHHHSSSSSAAHRSSHSLFPSYSSSSHHHISPAPTAPSPDRRRPGHARGRRSLAARMSTIDPVRSDDDDFPRVATFEALDARRPGGPPSHHPPLTENELRQMQMARGMTTKSVASRMTLQSLQSVQIDDLPSNERACVICYNDYGVQTPEGVNEAPLRLPKCKHVFGDHCIKKWFEDSDACPYCRDKLHAEHKRSTSAARHFMNAARLRNMPDSAQHELWERAMYHTNQMLDAGLEGQELPERRGAGDEGELRRRIPSRRSPLSADDETVAALIGEEQRLMERRVLMSGQGHGPRNSGPHNLFFSPPAPAAENIENRPQLFHATLHSTSSRHNASRGDGADAADREPRRFHDQPLPNPLQSPLRQADREIRENADLPIWMAMTGSTGTEDRPTASQFEAARRHRANRQS